MDFRVIKVKKRNPNNFDSEETFVIPVKVIKVLENKSSGPVVPIIVERVDFFSGKLKNTKGISFKKTINDCKEFGPEIPFVTDAIVYKENNKVKIKVIGIYNTGIVEKLFSVEDYILDNDEKQIMDLYESNYSEIRNWIGNINSNEFDV